jgi:hypothetical protein
MGPLTDWPARPRRIPFLTTGDQVTLVLILQALDVEAPEAEPDPGVPACGCSCGKTFE